MKTSALLLLLLPAACTGSPPAADPEPTPEPPTAPPSAQTPLPQVELSLPTRDGRSPVAVAATPQVQAARDLLVAVVNDHGRDPNNPWAIGHAMLALGPDVVLSNGVPAVDHLFAEYAEIVEIDGESAPAFPQSRGDIRIEPHTDLLLKAFAETGVDPERKVTVDGREFEVGDLYRTSLHGAWIEGDAVSFDSWNDSPWALQGLATWAPDDLAWTAAGGREMGIDRYTSDVVEKLADENAFLRLAAGQGRGFEKRGQHIFGYTCGGAHLFQGAAYAVGRGHGSADDRDAIALEVAVLFFRLREELAQVDAAIRMRPELAPLLLEQRLKFLGHFLESTHKAAAMELFTPTAPQISEMAFALEQLLGTVDVLQKMGVFDKLTELRVSQEQMYLDFVGDSAHALRGIDMATGVGAIRY